VVLEWVPRAIVAFNEHFFREAFQTGALSSDIASRFYRTRRGERPTRSALTLVLDWGDGALADPIDRVARLDGLCLGVVLFNVSVFNKTSTISSLDEHSEFILRHVGKWGETKRVAMTYSVMFVDFLYVGDEILIAHCIFLPAFVGFVVKTHERCEIGNIAVIFWCAQ